MAQKAGEAIVLSIKVDEGPTRDRLKEITLLLASQNKAYRELQAEIKRTGVTTEAQAKMLVDYKANINSLNIEYRTQAKLLELNAKQNEAAAGSYQQLAAAAIIAKNKLNTLEGTLEANADGTYKLTDAYLEAKKTSDEANKALNEFDLGVNKGGRNVGLYAESIAGLEQKLKDLVASQKQMNFNSEEFKNTQDEIDETTNKLGILTGKFDEFGNREPRNPEAAAMDSLADVTGAVISGFELLNIVQSENEGVNAAQAASLRAIAVAQNLRNIQIGIANAGEAAGVVITKAATLATNAKTTATGAATVATRIFNTVIKSNPIGLLIAGLVAAGVAIVAFTDKFNIASKVATFFNENFSGVVKWLERTGQSMGLVDTATEKALKNISKRQEAVEDDIKILEAQGDKEREIYEKRQRLMSQELALLIRHQREKGKLTEEEKKRMKDLYTDLAVLNTQERNRQAKEKEDAEKDAKEKAKDRLEEAKKEVEAALERRKELLDIQKGYIELRLDQVKKGDLEELKLREQLIRKQLEIDNTGAKISRERRVLNEKKAAHEILKIYDDYFKDLEIKQQDFVFKVLGPLNEEHVKKQMEGTVKKIEDEKRYKSAVEDAEFELNQTRIDAGQQGLEILRGFLGEQSELATTFFLTQKALAIADILVNLQREIAIIGATYAAFPLLIPPLTLAAKIRAGIGVATVAAQTVKEVSMGQGGIVEGESHSGPNRGVRGTGAFSNVLVEGGEAVINKTSTSKYRDLLSAINVAGGGKPLTVKQFMAAGGITATPAPVIIPKSAGVAIDYKRLASEIAKVRQVVTVSDIKAGLSKAEVKQSKTDI
ncbi:hypothetical protein [Adhaeribacter aquaticus]|uniref:hypothetical protein n=1 Tax=Adhaeribacter aquaticus TaxID=299567 RepID=UPI00040A4407|nr:hypothetical protein [Adhaeribacter aquaticus]